MENFLKKKFIDKDGILSFEIKDEKTKKVTNFYSEQPFPNYKTNDDRQTILEKGNKNFLAHQFKKFIGYKKNVLEVGCGTGQLSNYFAIGTNNNIIGLDPTKASLNLAKEFAEKNDIQNIKFVNADIFDDVLKENFFDFIWTNGVLHHTKDPYLAFQNLIKLLKEDGIIILGLYNKISRLKNSSNENKFMKATLLSKSIKPLSKSEIIVNVFCFGRFPIIVSIPDEDMIVILSPIFRSKLKLNSLPIEMKFFFNFFF